MQALTSYLRKASDQSPSASYYNVDILKYQVSRAKTLIHINVCTSGMMSGRTYIFRLQTSQREEMRGKWGGSRGSERRENIFQSERASFNRAKRGFAQVLI